MNLSIIVPVYNMAADGKLEYCLDSLLHQTIYDYEIIAVDDASTDDSFQILREYAAQYPDVMKVYACPENRKQGGAKNIGLKHARGKWIGFIDSDDWIAPDMYEKLLAKAKETGADMVACNYHLTHEHSDAIGQEVHTHYAAQTGVLDREKYKLLILDPGSLVIKIYRRNLIYDCGMLFPEHIFYEDNAIANAIVLKAKHFEYVDEPLYAYYQHQTSTVHTITQERCRHRMEAARIMRKHAQDFGYLDTYYAEIEFKFTLLFYVNTLFGYLQGIQKRDIGFLEELGREMLKTFPNFRENPYYKARVNSEERMFIDMQLKNTRVMLAYYDLKWKVRNIRKKGIRALLPGMLGGVLGVLLCVLAVWFAVRDTRSLEYPVVLLGDSIIANDFVGAEVDEMLQEAWGIEVFNGGFGGTLLCNPNREYYATFSGESLSLDCLTDSIITGDFAVQKSVIQRTSSLDYFEERLDTLSQIDFGKTKILILEHCVNDYANQIDPEEVYATLTSVIGRLQKKYPDLDIWVSSPTYCYIQSGDKKQYCDTRELGPYLLEEYVEAEAKVCQELSVGFIDNFHQDTITRETVDTYSMDGLHLNEQGRQFIADNIIEALQING